MKEPTCTHTGLKTRHCKLCGKEEEQTIKKKDHEYGKWTVVKEATCVREGERTRTCKVCGHEQSERIAKTPHEYGPWTITREATDHSSGRRTHTCEVCGHEESQDYDPEGTLRRRDRGEDVRALQQLLVDQSYLNVGGADGIYGGSTEKAVTRFQTDQGLNADGIAWPQTQKRLKHDFGPWETIRPMTRTEPGLRQRVCRDCGYVQTETVEPGDVIERGARSDAVRAIQQMLKQVGYDADSFDGIYGKKLDAAFADFDAKYGLSFEAGRVRPADLDALVSAWLEMGEAPLREGDSQTPVDLALSITPQTDAVTDDDVTTYAWSLTNLGSEKCMFNALLLTYGDHPDFSRDDLVMVIDGEELKADGKNHVSGSFSVAREWGEGSQNFAAIAVSEKTGEKWISNTVAFKVEGADEPRTVDPLPVELDVTNLPDGVYPVAFDPGDVASVTSGIYMNAVHFYTMDLYDGETIRGLKAGDTVMFGEDAIDVRNVEYDGDSVIINGTAMIPTGDGDTYRLLLYGDLATYTDQGTATVMVDPSATYVDSSDLDKGEVTVGYDGLVSAIQTPDDIGFNKFNTTVKIEGGRVTEINRVYTA